MANDFGTNSPNTTWKNVITLKAIIKDKVFAIVPVILIFSKSGRSKCSTVGSPSQPSPKEVIVIPS